MNRTETMTDVAFRAAARADLPAIVQMLADDHLGGARERFEEPLPQSYHAAFDAIDGDPNNELIVAALDGAVVGVLQLTFIPSISHQGGWRAQIEGVRVSTAVRSRGLGGALLRHAIARAQDRGCTLVQLTSDRSRTDAIRFYERLGFQRSHEGLKLRL